MYDDCGMNFIKFRLDSTCSVQVDASWLVGDTERVKYFYIDL